jgi:hypothetical protein
VWGEQVDAKVFRADGDAARTIWYLSKALNYVMKDTALAAMDGRGSNLAWVHLAELGHAARMMRCSVDCTPEDCSSRIHDRYGSRSHVVSASRQTRTRSGWSFSGLTRGRQRLERLAWVQSRETSEPTAPSGGQQQDAQAALARMTRRIDVARMAVLP